MKAEQVRDALLHHKVEQTPSTDSINHALANLHDVVDGKYKTVQTSIRKIVHKLGIEAPSDGKSMEDYANFKEMYKQMILDTKEAEKELDLEKEMKMLHPDDHYTNIYGALKKMGYGGLVNLSAGKTVIKDNKKVLEWPIADSFQLYGCEWSALKKYVDTKGKEIQHGLEYTKHQKMKQKTIDSSAHYIFPNPAGFRYGVFPKDKEAYGAACHYLANLFLLQHAPLERLARFIDAIDQTFHKTHRVVLNLDYYYKRSEKQQGSLHKDTTGTTLFVGLHYNNDKKMLGPEYLYDFWPQNFEKDRPQAPWINTGHDNIKYWPNELLSGLSLARSHLYEEAVKNNEQHLLHHEVMEKHGLVTFVDELIYHASPLPHKRIKNKGERDDYEKYFSALKMHSMKNIPIQNLFDKKHREHLSRRLSVDIDNEIKAENSNDKKVILNSTATNNRRSFVRFWVMVEPNIWFKNPRH